MTIAIPAPAAWRRSSVSKYCHVQLGKMLQTEPSSDEDELLPYLRAISISKEGIDLSHRFTMWIKPLEKEKFRLKRNDILVSEGGDAGRTAEYTSDEEFYFQNAINRVRPLDSQEVASRYLFYWFTFLKLSGYVDLICNVATIAHFTAEKVKAAPFVLPPLETQKRIAAFLDEKTTQIDGLIAKKRALLERLAEKRQAIITQAVTKGLNSAAPMKDSGIDWLGEIPAHWGLVPLKWQCVIKSGQVDPTQPPYDEMALIAPDHIESGTGRLLGVHTAAEQAAISGKYLCSPEDVLYSKIRPALRKVVMIDSLCLCSADMYAINPGREYKRDFLFYFLLTDAFTAYTELASMRVAMPKVNREAIGCFPLPKPPQHEQLEIIKHLGVRLGAIDASAGAVRRSAEQLSEYRSALITAAVVGQVEGLR